MNDERKYVLVCRDGHYHLRLRPHTADNPTPGQVRSRLRFGEIARRATGRRMDGDLPPAAEAVRVEMKGYETGERQEPPQPLWRLELERDWMQLGKKQVEEDMENMLNFFERRRVVRG